ncbi:GTPase [Desulfovibrionales bacterium]
MGRQLGLLIDRHGRPTIVIVGDPENILIPELPRGRMADIRLRGLRLLHTHLKDEPLSQEDLMDLVFLRLDALTVLTVTKGGEPLRQQYAHLLPNNLDNKAWHISELEPWDRININYGAIVAAIEDKLAHSVVSINDKSLDVLEKSNNRAILVSISSQPLAIVAASLAELTELATTAGVAVVGTLLQRTTKPNSRYILGKGKLVELETLALQTGAGIIIFDGELSPAQLHNLADRIKRKVVDRTIVILDIFAQHATTKAGKLQVEMAQLKYAQPRLVGRNPALSRLMGGIGSRGPGESMLEMDRRKIHTRICQLKVDLDKLRRQRALVRERRAKAGLSTVSLVGYTNAGKSTLLNAIAAANVFTENKLFATLDPTTRRLRFPQKCNLIITDTVGFIRRLPAELITAFHATLKELETANLLLHVANAGHQEIEEQIVAVEGILQEMELAHISTLLVLNKWDLLPPAKQVRLQRRFPEAIPVSALTKEGLANLADCIKAHVNWNKTLSQTSQTNVII